MNKVTIPKVKVGDRVNVVLPEALENKVRLATVLEVNEHGHIAAQCVGNEDPAIVIPVALHYSAEELKKKVRGNTWHPVPEEKAAEPEKTKE